MAALQYDAETIQIAQQVKVDPGEQLLFKKTADVKEVRLENSGGQRLTYKLKTTRPNSLKPNKAVGMLDSHGSDKLKIRFSPTNDEKPFIEGDRVTVLLGVLPNSSMKPEQFWKTFGSDASKYHRVVLKLAGEGGEVSKKKAPKKKKAKKEPSLKEEEEEEEEPTSEDSEASTSESEVSESEGTSASEA